METIFPMIPKEELQVFQDLKDIHVVFDVGSRDDLDMYELRPDCEYHLFEPHIEFIGDLKQKLRELDADEIPYNIKINEFGLGDKEEMGIYYEQIQSFVERPFDWKMDERMYPLKTLDSYCKEKDIDHIDFLKIDTEGYDYKILLGGSGILKNTKYVQVEWGDVKRLADLLTDFNLYLMMEPVLERVFKYKGLPVKLLMPLTDELIGILDNAISPTGAGGNLLGVRK